MSDIPTDAKEAVDKALVMSRKISNILAGAGPEAQGATIANILSIYIAGHHPECREQVLASLLECAEKLVPVSEREMGAPWKNVVH